MSETSNLELPTELKLRIERVARERDEAPASLLASAIDSLLIIEEAQTAEVRRRDAADAGENYSNEDAFARLDSFRPQPQEPDAQMTILWAKQAYGDLDGIANYLAGLSDEAAERTINRIQQAVLLLGEFPNMGTKVDETGLRKLVVSDCLYVVFYRVLADSVSIRGVFHASQRRFLE